MESDENHLTTQYFSSTNPNNSSLHTQQYFPNSGISNAHRFITSSTCQNYYPLPYTSTAYSLPVASNNRDRYAAARFAWTQDTKPQYSFASHAQKATTFDVNNYEKSPVGTFGYKRKTKSPPPVPVKQHITEERMAEHMSQLRISSETELSENEAEPIREQRLYMCEEMQRLQTESIIPIQILEKIPRPCTALIPWKPPIHLTSGKENNNNEETFDNNISLPLGNSDMDTCLFEF